MVAAMIAATLLLAAYVAFCDRVVTAGDDDVAVSDRRPDRDREPEAVA